MPQRPRAAIATCLLLGLAILGPAPVTAQVEVTPPPPTAPVTATPIPTASPTATPTATPTPTPTPSPSPTPTPEPIPTASPTPSPTPTPEPTPPPLTSLGADRVAVEDDFSVPGIWGVVDDADSSIVYEDDSLLMTIKEPGTSRWTTRRPAQTSPGMRLEVAVELGADDSSTGPMCGSLADGSDFTFGAVTTDDVWFVARLIDNSVSILGSGALEGTDVVIDQPVRMAIECAMTEGGDRVALWVDGQLVADISGEEPHGPYDHVGVYADASSAGSTVRVDDAVAYDAGPVPGLQTLGADTQVLADDFSVPGAWGVADGEASRIAVEDGSLGITLKQVGGQWTTLPAPAASNEMRLDVAVEIGAAGSSAGPMCLSGDSEPDAAFAVVNTDEQWAVGRMVLGSPRIIASGGLDGVAIEPGVPVRMALECAITPEGDRMAFWIDGQLVADVTSTQQHGPYASVGAYADASVVDTTVRFDDAVILSGDPVDITGLGADSVVLEDAFDTHDTWSTGKTSQGRVAYGKRDLRLTLRKPGSVSTWLTLVEPTPVLRLESDLRLDGRGQAGAFCGTPDESAFYFTGLTTTDEIVIGFAMPEMTTELLRVPLPAEVAPSTRHRLAVECAVTGSDADRVIAWVDGVLVADHITATGSLGDFGSLALFAEGKSRRFEAIVDDVVISTGTTYAPTGVAPG